MNSDSDETSNPPAAVRVAVQHLLADLDDVCAEIFRTGLLASPEVSRQPRIVLEDIRQWQRWLVGAGLTALLEDRPFGDLGSAISRTARRRRAHGIDLSISLKVVEEALRVVNDRLVAALGPGADIADLAYVNRRMLEFLRVISVHSAAPPQQAVAGPLDRAALMASLLEVLLAEDHPDSPDDPLIGRTAARAVELAEQAQVPLPIRHVLAIGVEADAIALQRSLPGVLVAVWRDCLVLLASTPVPPGRRVHGSAEVRPGLPGTLRAALEGARCGLRAAVATGSQGLSAEASTLIGAVLDVPAAGLEAAARACFGDLTDSERGAEMLETVSAVLTWGQAAAAARALHLHRHTLEYRLRRFEELSGSSLDDPVVRLRCHLALLAMGRWPHRPG